MIKEAKGSISSSYESEDYILIQAVNAYSDTERSYNLVFERLSEWYGIYYPEVRVQNPATLAELATVMNERESIDKEKIDSVIRDMQKSEIIYNKAVKSMGRKIASEEKHALMSFVELSKRMNATLTELDNYIKATSNRIMPNVTYLTDHKIAAELLAKAGSMERLSTMPASTIQLLGAEKALFKHIKFGSKPPKHGILFKLPAITNAEREKRGMIARVYATKICIALKADYFSKNFIAESLKKSLDESLKRIEEKKVERKPMQPQNWRRQGMERRNQGRNAGRRPDRRNKRPRN